MANTKRTPRGLSLTADHVEFDAHRRRQRLKAMAQRNPLRERAQAGDNTPWADRLEELQEDMARNEYLAAREVLVARLKTLSRAEEKLREGTYGRCDACDKPIPAGRLRAVPGAVHCVRCAEHPDATMPPAGRGVGLGTLNLWLRRRNPQDNGPARGVFAVEKEVAMNRMKAAMLLAALTALFLWVGQSLGGQQGFVLALLLAGGMNFASYWWSDRIVLRMHGAQEVTEREAPDLHGLVRRLSQRAGMPMPRVYMIPEEAPNAFATGRDPHHGAVAVTHGLLRILDREELAGAIAHELAHIKNRDTLIMTVAATLAGAIGMLANMAQWALLFGRSSEDEDGGNPLAGLVGIIVAPIAAMLIQMAISRAREFVADEGGAEISADPMGLASALRKIEGWSREVPMEAGTPATAHLFIVNPFAGGGMLKLFSTHPPTEERVARLRGLARRRLGLSV